jgi:hypothetical protein
VAERSLIPPPVRRLGGRLIRRGHRTAVRADLGSLRRLRPLSEFGWSRGRPIDRYYLDAFLAEHASFVRGRVLEIAESTYTRRFGGDAVERSDVLHVIPGEPETTIVGDLATGEGLPDEAFDCLLLTQTIQCIYDIQSAVATTHRALKPGGAVLATASGINRTARYDMERWGEWWRLTDRCIGRLFADHFGESNVSVRAYGNVLSACAFLHGMAAEDLERHELDTYDPDFPVLVAVCAVKDGSRSPPPAQ